MTMAQGSYSGKYSFQNNMLFADLAKSDFERERIYAAADAAGLLVGDHAA